MATTLTLPPTADLAGSWELDNPLPFSGSTYTEPRVIGSVGVGYQGGDAGAQATNNGLALPTIATPPTAIEFIGSDDVYVESSGTTLSVPIPAVTVAVGDLIEIMVATQELEVNDPGTPNTPAGMTSQWELHTTQQYRPHVTKFYEIAAGGESGNISVSWPASGGNRYGVCQVWRGVDQVNPYDTSGYISGAPPWVFGYSISPPDPPAFTVSVDGSVVQVIACGDRSSSSSATISAGYATTIDGNPSAAPSYRAFANGHKTVSAGVVDPAIYTWDRSNWVAATDVLRPAGGAVTALMIVGVDDATATAQVATAPTLLAQNEEQTLVDNGGLAAFTLTFDGQTTASISATADAAAVLSALELLSNIAVNDVAVDGGPLGTAPIRVAFEGTYEATDVALISSSDPNLGISVTQNAAAVQTFTFEDTINVVQGNDEPQVHVWRLDITSGYWVGRLCSFVAADHETLDSWTAILLIVEDMDSASFPAASGADTMGTGSAAAFGTVTPAHHGSKVLAIAAKASGANYSTWPTSSPTPTTPGGYAGYHATADRMTLSAYVSPPLAAAAEVPATVRWSAAERYATVALAIKPTTPSAAGANLYSVVADSDQSTWLEIGNALGQMWEVLEVGLSAVPVGAVALSAYIRFTHEADALNAIEVAVVGINSDDSTVLGSTKHTALSLVGTPETVETQVWSELADGSKLHEYSRLGILVRSLAVVPGTASHKIFDAELVLEVEEGGAVVSAVAGPAVDGDPITWTYSSDAGYPQTHYQVRVMRGTVADPDAAAVAADSLAPADGEIFYDSGQVSSSTARALLLPSPLTSGTLTYAVRAWTQFANGVSAPSAWDTATSDLTGVPPSLASVDAAPSFNSATGVVSMTVTTPAAVSRGWLQSSVDAGSTWVDVYGSPISLAASSSVVLEDPSPPINESATYRLALDDGVMTESSAPESMGAAVATTGVGWYLQNRTNSTRNMIIDVAEIGESQSNRQQATIGEFGALVALSLPLGAVLSVSVRTSSQAERAALAAILGDRETLRLVNILGREWNVAEFGDRGTSFIRVQPLPSETTPLRDFHIHSVTFREVIA